MKKIQHTKTNNLQKFKDLCQPLPVFSHFTSLKASLPSLFCRLGHQRALTEDGWVGIGKMPGQFLLLFFCFPFFSGSSCIFSWFYLLSGSHAPPLNNPHCCSAHLTPPISGFLVVRTTLSQEMQGLSAPADHWVADTYLLLHFCSFIICLTSFLF